MRITDVKVFAARHPYIGGGPYPMVRPTDIYSRFRAEPRGAPETTTAYFVKIVTEEGLSGMFRGGSGL